jgi:hypothetical protein
MHRQQPLVDKAQNVEASLQEKERMVTEQKAYVAQLKDELGTMKKCKIYGDVQLAQIQDQHRKTTEHLARRVRNHLPNDDLVLLRVAMATS